MFSTGKKISGRSAYSPLSRADARQTWPQKRSDCRIQKILSQNPNHVPTHLFLGLAYTRDKQLDSAVKELRWVVENSRSEKYRHWAQAQLTRVKRGGKKVGKPVKKKPYLLGKIGAYYDSFRGNILMGDLGSRTALRLIREWIDPHQTELMEDWELARAAKEIKKIAPLE